MTITCGRVNIAWDAAHRVLRHEAKCSHLHGHRYAAEVEFVSDTLDDVGRVVDFGEIKRVVGAWVDRRLDHATLVNPHDTSLRAWLAHEQQRHFVMPDELAEPTAEHIAVMLHRFATARLDEALRVTRVRVWETPNCYAEVTP